MAEKRILITKATSNMVLADDVYTLDNRLVISKGTVLTDEVIAALKDYSIFAIRIVVENDGETPVLKEGEKDVDMLPKLDISEEMMIDPFSAAFVNPVTDEAESDIKEEREEYFSQVRETKEFKEFHGMLSDIDNVVSKGRNSLHILDMLQCMRGYNDVTYVHCLNVALLSNMIGRIVYPDMDKAELDVLTLSGLLCDIGKMLVPEEIIMKKGRLTLPEYNIVKTHVFHGNNILKRLNLDPRIAEVAMRHHERCDGSGYPGGYRRDQIEEFARIVAIADTYDAMTSDRVYRSAMCPFDVIHMFELEGLVKYDVIFLLPFLEKAVQTYVNAKVRLSNDEIGRIIMINQKEFSKPIVQVGDVFYDLSEDSSIRIRQVLS